MTPMQKIEEAWVLVRDRGIETMLEGISAKGKNNRFIRIPYTTTIADGKVPVIRVMDWKDFILSGWYTLEEFKAMIEKYGFELTEEL